MRLIGTPTSAPRYKTMVVEDEYRKHADKCRFLAECRVFWLLLAQNWQLLAKDMEAEAEDEFKVARSNAAGTSSESHRALKSAIACG